MNKIIDTIQTSLKEEIEQCGNPSLEREPVSYGTVLGLKAALSIVHAVCKVEEAKEETMDTVSYKYKPTEKIKFEKTSEHQILNPITKEIWCNWFYKNLSEPYQIYCHFPECNLEKCPKKGERKCS